jgi:hypothetical protein
MERCATPMDLSRYNGRLAENIKPSLRLFDNVLPHIAAEPGQTQ